MAAVDCSKSSGPCPCPLRAVQPDPQFRRNRERVVRDAEREAIQIEWDLGCRRASISDPSADGAGDPGYLLMFPSRRDRRQLGFRQVGDRRARALHQPRAVLARLQRAGPGRGSTPGSASSSGSSSSPSSPRTSTSSSGPGRGPEGAVASGVTTASPDGPLPAEQLARSDDRVHRWSSRGALWHDELLPRLLARRHPALDGWDLDGRAEAGRVFAATLFPASPRWRSTPATRSRTSRNQSLNLAVLVREGPTAASERFARVKVPQVLPRFVPCPTARRFCAAREVIAAHLDDLFPGMEVVEHLGLPRHPQRGPHAGRGGGRRSPPGDGGGAAPPGGSARRCGSRSTPSIPGTSSSCCSRARAGPRGRVPAERPLSTWPACWRWTLSTGRTSRTRPRSSIPRLSDVRSERSCRRVRADPRATARAPPLRVVRVSVEAFIGGGGRRPARAGHQADALPDQRGQPDRRQPRPRRRDGQAGGGARRAQGPLRRGAQHRLGPRAGGGRRARRLRPRRPEDARQGRAGRAPRGRRHPPLRATWAPATTTRRPPRSTRTSACSPPTRRSATTSPTCSTYLTGYQRPWSAPLAARGPARAAQGHLELIARRGAAGPTAASCEDELAGGRRRSSTLYAARAGRAWRSTCSCGASAACARVPGTVRNDPRALDPRRYLEHSRIFRFANGSGGGGRDLYLDPPTSCPATSTARRWPWSSTRPPGPARGARMLCDVVAWVPRRHWALPFGVFGRCRSAERSAVASS